MGITLKFRFIIGFFFFLYFVLALPFYSGDIKNHLVWAESLLNIGLFDFYFRDFHNFAFPNYPPLAMLMFAISLFLYKFLLSLLFILNNNLSFFPSFMIPFFEWENTKIAFLKIPGFFPAVAIGYCSYLFAEFIDEKRFKILIPTIFLINPAVIYLASIWGQIDLLPISFILFAVYFLLKKQFLLSIILASLSLLTKQTVMVFYLIYILLVLKQWGIKYLILSIITTAAVFYLAYFPFDTFSFIWPIELYKLNYSLVAFSTSENAINFWGYITHFKRVDDTQFFIFLTMQQWGYLLFGILIILLGYVSYFKKELNLKNILTLFFLITISYFFFLTRMHERYLIPSVVFLSLLAFLDRRFIFGLIFFSLVSFLNLYRGLFEPSNFYLTNLVNSIFLLKILVWGYLLSMIYYFYIFVFRNKEK